MKDPRGGQNRIVNNNPFKISTDESYYWIGFLAADGYISSKKYSIGLKLKDVEHIIKYRDFINPALKLYDKINTAGNLMREVLFGNYEIHKYLITLGITPKKSKTFKYTIPITGSILRGHFDGDGSVSQGRPKITTGSVEFLHQLEELYKSLDIKYTVCKKGDCWDIYTLYHSRRIMFNYMYKDSTIHLERKYLQFKKCLPCQPN